MKFKVGDRVSFGGLKGVVKRIIADNDYSLKVEFDNGDAYNFTNDGRFLTEHTKPLLKKLKTKLVKFKAGDEVIVRGVLKDNLSLLFPLKVITLDGEVLITITEDGREHIDGPVVVEKVKNENK